MTANGSSPSCPRCGYDQSGAVATWTDRCPVAGTCPECGTDFHWADLFDPSRQDIRWLVEHAATRSRIWARTPATLWHVARPSVFWRQVGVHSRIRLGRLLMWCTGVLASMHLLTTVGLWYNQYQWMVTVRARARTRVGGWLPGKTEELQAVLDAVAEPLLTLFAGPGWTNAAGGWGLGAVSATGFRVPAWLAASLGFTLTWTLVLGVIPTTRRLARIRPAHIARAAILAVFAAAMTVELVRVEMFLVGTHAGRAVILLSGWMVIGAIGFMLAWTCRWWWSAAVTGWGLRPARFVAVLGFVAALLGGTLSALACDMPGVARALARWI